MENAPPSSTKVRVVRCPRCPSLLPEPTDVPFYSCGGCGTLLQDGVYDCNTLAPGHGAAKHYKKESERRTTSDCPSFAQHDEAECGHESPSAKLISNPQHSQEHNEGIDQDVARNGILEQLVVPSSSKEVSLSNQLEAKPQSASASQRYQDTNGASFSNELAHPSLEDPSNFEVVVFASSEAKTTTSNEMNGLSDRAEELKAAKKDEGLETGSTNGITEQLQTLSCSSAVVEQSWLITDNREMDVLLQIESDTDDITSPTEVNSPKKEELQLAATRADEETSETRNETDTGVSYLADVPRKTVEAYPGDKIEESYNDLADGIESLNAVKSLKRAEADNVDSVGGSLPRDLHKSLMRNSSTYDGSVYSYDQANKSGEYYIWNKKHSDPAFPRQTDESRRVPRRLAAQRTPPMLNEIEEFLPRAPSYPRSADLSYLNESIGSSSQMDDDFYNHHFRLHPHRANVDNRMLPQAIYPRLSYRRYRIYDPYMHLCDASWEALDTYTTSPRVFSDSEYYTWGYDTTFEDQRHRDQYTSRFQLRRTSQPKRHICPMAGSAPFVTCYQCLELLELPLDFLLFNRRSRRSRHRVKCSACSSILEFALEKGRQLVPYTVPSGSFEAVERREGEKAQDKGKSTILEKQSYDVCSAYRNRKSGCEEPTRSSSQLHRLMGYATPRAMLHGYDTVEENSKNILKAKEEMKHNKL